MNVIWEQTIVTQMPHVPIQLEASVVPVTQDTLEMESSVLVIAWFQNNRQFVM